MSFANEYRCCPSKFAFYFVEPISRSWHKKTLGSSPSDSAGCLHFTNPEFAACTKFQGISVRATRKPTLRLLSPLESPARLAERRAPGISFQEPPRAARLVQSPVIHAEPSV